MKLRQNILHTTSNKFWREIIALTKLYDEKEMKTGLIVAYGNDVVSIG